MAIDYNKPMTSVAEWNATFVPNSISEDTDDETPKLMWLAHGVALRAVREVKGKPVRENRRASRVTKR